MSKIIVVMFISIAVVGICQDHPPVVVPVTPVPSAVGPVPRLNKGVVEGRTYKNASVGIELTPAPELTLGTPKLNGRGVMIAALGERKWFSVADGTFFYTDILAYYPKDQRATEARLQSVVQDNRKAGFEPVGGTTQGELGGVAFARTDFKKAGAYLTDFVKVCDAQALVFVFYGADREEVNKLVSATYLKLDLAISGCGSKAGGSPKN